MEEDQKCITDDLSEVETTELLKILPSYFGTFSKDPYKTAILNWRFEFNRHVENQFFDMAKAYFRTSIELIEKCIGDNRDHKADLWIFPIMFNVVHGIEVYLKGLNSLQRILMKLQQDEFQESKIEGKHDLKQLCQIAIKLLREGNKIDMIDEMLFVQRFIEILYLNTDDMTFTRYPVTKKGKTQFYNQVKENVVIDLDVFRQWIIRVFCILDKCTSYIDLEVEQLREWQAEMKAYFGDY